jgi:hypothetical protein
MHAPSLGDLLKAKLEDPMAMAMEKVKANQLAKQEQAFPKDLTKSSDEGLSSILGLVYKEVNNFKPGGKAREVASNLWQISLEYQRRFEDVRDYKAAYEKRNEEYAKMVRLRDVAESQLQVLKQEQFSLRVFNEFAEKLYRILGKEGPNIREARDLSRFVDFIAASMDRCDEPDVP